MTNEQFITSIRKTFDDGLALIEVKNKDYANSADPFRNFRSASIVGLEPDRAILVRVLDKIARVSNLLDNEAAVSSERLEDTLLDCINYVAILKAYRESLTQERRPVA